MRFFKTHIWAALVAAVLAVAPGVAGAQQGVRQPAYALPQASPSNLGGVTVSTGLLSTAGALSVIYGTTAGTAAQGNDARIVGALQTSGGTMTGNLILNGANIQSDAFTSYAGGDTQIFKNGPNGQIMLEMGGSNPYGQIYPQVPVNFAGNWNLTNYAAPLFQNQTITGTTTGGGASFGAFLQQTDNSSNTGNGTGFTENLTVNGSNAKGGREAGQFNLNVNLTGNGTTTYEYAGLGSKCNLNFTEGTGSSCFGANPVASVGPGVTANQMVGTEIDTWGQSGAVITDRIGLQIVDVTGSTYGARATRDDVALSLNNQYNPSSTLGFGVGIEFGRTGGDFPVLTTGTMIGAQGNGGTGFTVANGIDWHLGTFTGNAINLPGFTVDGSGDVAAKTDTIGTATLRSQPCSLVAANGNFAANGDAQSRTCLLRAVSTSTAAARLTADGLAASATNCLNLPNNTVYGIAGSFVGIDDTTPANFYSSTIRIGTLARQGSAATTSYQGDAPTSLANSGGAGSGVTPTATADTTNGCLNISVVPPNADTWHWVFRALTVEVQ